MCAAHKCICLSTNQSQVKHNPLTNMSLVQPLDCTCDHLTSENSKFTSSHNCDIIKSDISTTEIQDTLHKAQHSHSKKSLYISKACKYSFIASDYTSPEGQKLLSIKVYQNPPQSDSSKGKNFLSKRSISEYFLSKNGVDKDNLDEKGKENNCSKLQCPNSKIRTSLTHQVEESVTENTSFLQDSTLNFLSSGENIQSSNKSSFSLHFHKQRLNSLDSEPCASGLNECGEGKVPQSGFSDDRCSCKINLNPNVNFKVFDIESLSEAGEPCDNGSIENNTHFGLDDAWFIPSARHTFSGADISGSTSAAQISITSSFGDSSLPICKICHTAAKPEDPLISPCRCTGTLKYIHCGCLMKWLEICNKRSRKPPICELCKYQFHWHKKFKVGQWQFPHCSWQDKILHTVFLLSVLIMIGCAIVTVLCFKQHRGVKSEITHLELTQSEIVTLICGALFFLSFFLAMYVEIKARNTIYKLLLKFIYLNQQWYIDEYDRRKENSAIDV